MATLYASSEQEQKARDKLYAHVKELRASLLDLLSMVDERSCIDTTVPMSEANRLRRAAADAEHRAHKIRRARAIIDGTEGDAELTGKLSKSE